MKIATSLIAGFMAGFLLIACTDDSTANSGPTQADFDALKSRVYDLEFDVAELREAIAELREAGQITYGLSGPAVASKISAAAVCNAEGTGEFSFASGFISCESDTGYLYAIPALTSGQSGTLYATTIYFTGTSCDGQGYIGPGVLGGRGLAKGTVLSSNGLTADYYAVEPETPVERDVVYQSKIEADGSCGLSGGTLIAGFKAVPNDPAVTSVANESIVGPTL